MKNIFLFISANILSVSAFAKSSDALCIQSSTSPPSPPHHYQILFKLGWSGGWFSSTAYVTQYGIPLENGELTCKWDYLPYPGMSAAYRCDESKTQEPDDGLQATIVPQQGKNSHYKDPTITYSAQLFRGNPMDTLGSFVCRDL